MLGAVLAAACAGPVPAPPPLPVAPIGCDVRLELVADEPAPAGTVWVRVLLEPLDGRDVRVEPVVQPDGSRPPALLELNVSWQDFSGKAPVAVGRARSLVLPWSGVETGGPGRPACLAARLDVGGTGGVLARRVLVEGRLIGVELRRERSRSGGLVLALPSTALEAAVPVPPGSLAQHLQSGAADGIFLAAVTQPSERRDAVLGTLIDALPEVDAAARNAVFAALLYLTGETHGTDIHRWRTWWAERQRARR